MGTLTLDFSKLVLAKVYAIQYEVTKEIRIQENTLAYQAIKNTRKVKEHKVLLRENDQEIEVHE